MIDVDTFLTTLYVTVDEYDKARKPQGETDAVAQQRGPAPSLSRSEVVTLAIFAQWACFESERAFYRYATRHLRAAFPGVPARSQFNRLVRQAQDLLVAVGQWLAGQLASGGCAYEVLDSTALVTRNAKRRGDGWLVGQADVGWSNRVGWYEGLHLLTAVTAGGVITGYGCAPASAADQRLAETLLAARARPQSRLPEVGRPLGGGYYLAIPTSRANGGDPTGAATMARWCSVRPSGTNRSPSRGRMPCGAASRDCARSLRPCMPSS
jgi:hypothetical protein